VNPTEVAGVHRRFRRPGPDRDRAIDDTCEQLEQLISMGTAEGLQQAIGQMDALLRG
jgi:hypothetical protein